MNTIQTLTGGILAVVILLAPGAGSERAQGIEITVDEVFASGFTHPVAIAHAGDGTERLFVAEQPGTIRVIHADGTVPAAPFLDLSGLTDDSGEQGLLGLAFHPDFANNGFVYVDYTRASDGATVVARYTVSPSNSDLADPGTALTILTVPQPYANHNGGHIAFGPDGYLYIALGDGGGAGDPDENAQDPGTLLGSLLRIDVDRGSPYAIPPDNPFVDTSGQDEIWAYGLRNPWRFSFDRLTHDLYIGDVGQAAWEEVDVQAAGSPGGLNYGWDCLEGTHAYEWDSACEAASLTPPIVEYDHSEGRSITGGYVYRGSLYPRLRGTYVFADFVSGQIWGIPTSTWPGGEAPAALLDTELNISTFGEDEAGELYVADRSGGTIRRVADVAGPFTPTDVIWLPLVLRNG